jgi:hypothetical protein
MLNINGKANIGDVTITENGYLKTALMTFNSYSVDNRQISQAEFWHAAIVGSAKDILVNAKKGESISFKGFIKNWYNEENKSTYETLVLYDGEILAPQRKKDLTISVSGKGKIGDIDSQDIRNRTTLMTYEKIDSPDNGEVTYKHMYWNLALSNKVFEGLKNCSKGDIVEIKKAALHNSFSEKTGKKYINLSVYAAKALPKTANVSEDKLIANEKDYEQSNLKNTIVVNAFAGPGAGKTTSALSLVAELKKKGIVAEYVSEYAKELVWEKRFDLLDGKVEHEKIIYEEKMHRITRLMGQVDVIVTDSSLIQSVLFLDENKCSKSEIDSFTKMALHDFSKMKNFNYFVERGQGYEPEGRIHTFEESINIDKNIKKFLLEQNIKFSIYSHGKKQGLTDIAGKIEQQINPKIKTKQASGPSLKR